MALERLSPVTHSVANTLKRVVIIITTCLVFKTPMTLIGGVGSGVAVAVSVVFVVFRLLCNCVLGERFDLFGIISIFSCV